MPYFPILPFTTSDHFGARDPSPRPPHEYFPQHYSTDFSVFVGGMDCGFLQGDRHTMCGLSLFDSLLPHKRHYFTGLTEFVVCQFELNLLNQAIYTHFRSAHSAWIRFSEPFADTRLCASGHGMGSHVPDSILRFAQEPFEAPCVAPVSFAWDILGAYTLFFLRDYVARFIEAEVGAGFSLEEFLQSVSRDHACTASVHTPRGWETKHVMELLNLEHKA